MSESDQLAAGFEQNRPRLRAVAYRMLGSVAEAEDAVQEAWLRASRADTSEIDSLTAWLTTIVARVCLNMLRSRQRRHEQPVGVHMPDPIVTRDEGPSPEDEALLADSVGLALNVVLEMLSPAERLAFVLHDLFDLPFEDIAPIVGRTPVAARQLASRARRRVRGAEVPDAEPDVRRQRQVVDAFYAAARGGDFEALVALLDPVASARVDGGTALASVTTEARGAEEVAAAIRKLHQRTADLRPVLVNGAAGVVAVVDGRPSAIIGFTIAGGKVSQINVLADPERIAKLDLTALEHAS
jgi:RNA polymerase sigma-70 factor (ECF subfamily)